MKETLGSALAKILQAKTQKQKGRAVKRLRRVQHRLTKELAATGIVIEFSGPQISTKEKPEG